jgi:hypothetical protein
MSAWHWLDNTAERFKWIAHALLWGGILSLGVLLWDRNPPFEVIDVYPAVAYPGDFVQITAKVRRDTGRHCDAEFSRYIFDADGSRFDLGQSLASASFIRALEERKPGELTVTVQVPAAAQPGPATLDTVLEYRCNITHSWWPIHVETSLPFEILQRP